MLCPGLWGPFPRWFQVRVLARRRKHPVTDKTPWRRRWQEGQQVLGDTAGLQQELPNLIKHVGCPALSPGSPLTHQPPVGWTGRRRDGEHGSSPRALRSVHPGLRAALQKPKATAQLGTERTPEWLQRVWDF